MELNTHFDVLDNKSSVLRRPSLSSMQNVALVASHNNAKAPRASRASHATPEKHELELSEKNLLLHPALEIEEDDDDLVADLVDEKLKKSEKEFCFV